MNINQLIQETTRVESFARQPETGFYTINFSNGQSVVTENKYLYEALFSTRSGNKNEVFQFCDHRDMLKFGPENEYDHKNLFVWFTDGGSFVGLSMESGGSYSFGIVSSFKVSFYSMESGYYDDQDVCYVSNQSQNFPPTEEGLQEAINCFLDRMKSPNPHKASEKWSSMSLQDIKSSLK